MSKATVNKMSEDEKRWRAEDDARTLKRHAELKNDPSRLSEAQKVIQNELTCLQAVASTTGAVSTKKTASASKATAKKTASTKSATKKTTKKSAPAKKSASTSKYRTDNVSQSSKSKKRGK